MTDQFDDKASPLKEVLNELFSLLEDLETKNEAIQEFLKAEGIVTDEKLKPYFDQAGNAASVRWRAARVRMEHLFSPVPAAVGDREPAKPAPKEKEGPDKPTGAKEKSETTANPDETTAQPIVENSAPGPDKAAAPTKDQSPNQQLSKAPNVDQPKAADQPQAPGQPQGQDGKGPKPNDAESKKTTSVTASASHSTAPTPHSIPE